MNKVNFYIPEILELKDIKGLDKKTYDFAAWYIHKIVTGNGQYRHESREYYNISRQTSQYFIPSRYESLVKHLLLKNRIIECDGVYAKGKKSLGYRLSEPYLGELKQYEPTNKALIAKIIAYRITLGGMPVAEDKLNLCHNHLLGWLKNISIDQNAAALILEKCLDKRGMVLGSYAKALQVMTMDALESPDFAVDNFGRVHTPVTRLTTSLRGCLNIENNKLFNLDIRNSQLVFFVIMYLESINNEYAKMEYESIDDIDILLSNKSLSLRDDSLGKDKILEDDAIKFISLVMDGTIYDYLMKLCNATDRKTFKQKLFCNVFYGQMTRWMMDTELAKLFANEFPSIWTFIKAQKIDGYEKLAQKMQARESAYMIGSVIGRLAKYHPEIPVVTIHDSILTTQAGVETVLRIMAEEFKRLGFNPAIRTEAA